MSSRPFDKCVACSTDTGTHCVRCKSAYYCSKICQEADWPVHRLLCDAFSTFDDSSRPTQEHIKAIFFPVDESKPKFVWLPCEWREEDDYSTSQSPQTASLLEPDAPPGRKPIQYNPFLQRRLANTIYVTYRDACFFDGSVVNKSVAHLLTKKPGHYHKWCGPIVAYGMTGQGNLQTTCRDLDMNDFRHVSDYFFTYDVPAPVHEEPTESIVEGVRINCEGDQKMLKKPKFERVQISSTDSIFQEHGTSPIADRIGLPIFTRRYPLDPRWESARDKISYNECPSNNLDAAYLHVCCDPNGEWDPTLNKASWG